MRSSRPRIIAGQKCRYYDYKDLGIVDYGAQRFECERGMYTLELGQSHLFEDKFFSFKRDEQVVFRYSEKVLMKPVFIGDAKPQIAANRGMKDGPHAEALAQEWRANARWRWLG